MRKILLPLLTIAAFALVSAGASAQYAFQDAVNIETALAPVLAPDGTIHVPPTGPYFAILGHYVPAGDIGNDVAIRTDFTNNPFLKIDVLAPAVAFRAPQMAGLGDIGSFDVTNVANGLSALLIDRAKQELTIAFFNRFKAFTTAHPEFGILFPTTTTNVGKLLSYAYPQILPILRNGFLSDLRALPSNITGLLDIDPYKTLFARYPALTVAIRSMKLIAELQSGASTPAQLFDEFAQFPEIQNPGVDPVMRNIAATVQLADLFSKSLRSGNNGETWVSPGALKPLLTNPALSTIYLGLLWQSANTANIQFYPTAAAAPAPVAFTALLAAIKPDAVPLLNRVNAFITLAGQLTTAYNSANHSNYIGIAIDAIDTAFGIVDLFQPKLNAKPYLNLARTGNALYKDIAAQQYTQAISDGLDVLGQLGTLAPNDFKDLSAFAEKAKPYVVFLSNLLEANSASDVQAALDNAILPVGSSSIKKNTRNNLAVQAYLGAYAVFGPNNPNATGIWSDRWGVTAPIGLSYTPGFLSWGSNGSLSIFLEVFDLGAIVDYQLRSDTVTGSNGTPTTTIAKSYSVQLGQILSPGGYLIYGAPANLPLALGFGAQYGPGLSHITATGQATVTNPSWRWNATLTVDLPLFNIWNVTRTQ